MTMNFLHVSEFIYIRQDLIHSFVEKNKDNEHIFPPNTVTMVTLSTGQNVFSPWKVAELIERLCE